MEAIFAQSSAADHQSISSYKQFRNQPKKNPRGLVSRSTENLAPTSNIIHGGLLFAPPHSVSSSYPPPSFSVLFPQSHSQPPLLPLPVSRPYNSFSSSRTPSTRKTNRTRDQSLTPKKSKQPIRKEEPRQDLKPADAAPVSAKSFIVASTVPLGPDPNDLPKDVSKVLSTSPPSSLRAGNMNCIGVSVKDLEIFSGSPFTLSPHPSSLPLPKFPIRPKLSCTAEAAGIDAGATDNLRRLLRLR